MELLQKFHSIILTSLFLFSSGVFYAQENYVVFNKGGTPELLIDSMVQPIQRGQLVKSDRFLKLKPGDTVRVINKQGKLRQINYAGKYDVHAIERIEPSVNKSQFSDQYFAYIYKELMNKNPENGIEFREDELVLMRFPTDSIRIYMDEINFEWNTVDDLAEDYYFLLKDLETEDLKTFECKDNYISLKIDDGNLQYGKDYEWAVSDTRFFKLNELRFFKFRVMTKDEFKAFSKDLRKLTSQLRRAGLNKDQVRQSICEFSKFCY